MTGRPLLIAMTCMVPCFGMAEAGQPGSPKPEMFVRPEDQERARLLNKPCAKSDVGHGCYRAGGHAYRMSPCAYRVGRNAMTSLPTDQCFKMEPPRRYRGIWVDEFEGQAFIPEGAKPPEWRHTDSHTPGWRERAERARAASIWLDVERVKLKHSFSKDGRRMFIDFIGRKTLYPGWYGHMGMSGHEIVVDRVIALKAAD